MPVATLRQNKWISELCQRHKPAQAPERAWRPRRQPLETYRRRPTRERCGSRAYCFWAVSRTRLLAARRTRRHDGRMPDVHSDIDPRIEVVSVPLHARK